MVLAMHTYQDLKKHIVLDERSAAFIALGIGRATHMPAAVLCTSGTAAANYLPAVIEARQSQTPLLVLTADRSNLDRANSAPQSMVQPGLYGQYPVFSYDAILPNTDEAIDRLEYLAWQAMDAAINLRGPVHINIPFDKPFEPDITTWLNNDRKARRTRFIAKNRLPDIESNQVPDELLKATRPIIIAGPSQLQSAETQTLIDRFNGCGIPILAEHSSGLGVRSLANERIHRFPLFLKDVDARAELKPDLIIRFGHFPVSKAVEDYLTMHSDAPEILFSTNHELASPHNPAGMRFIGLPSVNLIQEIAANCAPDWKPKWDNWSARTTNVRSNHQLNQLTDGFVHTTVLSHLPQNDTLFVSNSLAIRDLDVFGQQWDSDGHHILTARGVSGIDGVTSQAIGAALSSKKPVTLITGDLAFLHDINALMSSSLLSDTRLVVVVINNGGGQIFRSLPIGSFSDVYDTYFGTPQNVDMHFLCKANNVPHIRVEKASELSDALLKSWKQVGLTVVEVITDSTLSQEERK
jgi:2-succinyl-5-enolpyruvyl-6-hydroxy-3-cyclohexene-1-carboxylate synthase